MSAADATEGAEGAAGAGLGPVPGAGQQAPVGGAPGGVVPQPQDVSGLLHQLLGRLSGLEATMAQQGSRIEHLSGRQDGMANEVAGLIEAQVARAAARLAAPAAAPAAPPAAAAAPAAPVKFQKPGMFNDAYAQRSEPEQRAWFQSAMRYLSAYGQNPVNVVQFFTEGPAVWANEFAASVRGREAETTEDMVYHAFMHRFVGQAMRTLMAGVSAIVGPHGGAFPCLNYAPPQTLVLEFLVRRIVGYYEVAVTLDMRYWAFMYERASSKDDMNVDVDEVIHVMRMELGQQQEYVSLQPHSAFPGALMR